MTEPQYANNDFLNKLNEILENRFRNESFGVSELASALGKSRTSLHRKEKAAC